MYGQIRRGTQARSGNFSSLERQKRKFYINQLCSTSHQYNSTQRDPNVWPQTTNLNGWSHLYSGQRSLHSDCDTRWATQKSQFEPNRSTDFFSKVSHNIFGVQPASYLRVPPVKRPTREADHSTPYSELQNKWSNTSWRAQELYPPCTRIWKYSDITSAEDHNDQSYTNRSNKVGNVKREEPTPPWHL
jgi:hypothetical protein